jgi:hypothetical protein
MSEMKQPFGSQEGKKSVSSEAEAMSLNPLIGTGFFVKGMVTGLIDAKPYTDKETGTIDPGSPKVLFACEGLKGVQVKFKFAPDPNVFFIGSIHQIRLTYSVYKNSVYFAEA